MKMNYFKVNPGSKVELSKISTSYTASFKSKKEAEKKLLHNIEIMSGLQQKLYADDRYSLLIIFQAMDAAGKDGTISHVMSGLNPQGTQVFSFKQPSKEELDHGFLWRIQKCVPERGRIGIFNRSHYEDVLIVRVHNLIEKQKIPADLPNNNIWKTRFREINDFEKYLYESGTAILKFFLHVSKEEQKKRFIKRIDDPAKNWKFSEQDVAERKYWDNYQQAYQEAISATSTKHSPWYIIPADKKWFLRLAVSEIISDRMRKLNLSFPKISAEQRNKLLELKKKLEEE
ncbi:MAG TPA: polyphosphate kinase 2 family protein [Ignavibacteriaceae bacterium]|nr:polyphosphate kinase 2 family protein [Ignavibacteriaceae bacterium]